MDGDGGVSGVWFLNSAFSELGQYAYDIEFFWRVDQVFTKIVDIGYLQQRQEDDVGWGGVNFLHYENTPIQTYRKFHHQKTASFQIKNLIFFIYFCSKHKIVCTR